MVTFQVWPLSQFKVGAKRRLNSSNSSPYITQIFLFHTAPPMITMSPSSDLELLVSQTVTYTCEVKGIPTPTVIWYHNGVQLNASGVISISGNTLNISSLTVGHTGMYQCFANNVVGNTQRSWALQVREPSKGIPPSHSLSPFLPLVFLMPSFSATFPLSHSPPPTLIHTMT